MIKTTKATVFHGGTRRWLTRRAAIRAEARKVIAEVAAVHSIAIDKADMPEIARTVAAIIRSGYEVDPARVLALVSAAQDKRLQAQPELPEVL